MRQSQRQYSVEDYYFVDVGSPMRHEYFDGEIYAMPGSSLSHARITTNVLAALNSTACEAFHGDMRLMTPSGLYTYPDISVVCSEPEFIGEEERTTLLNPILIVEVLSDATHAYDRGEKFKMYRSIASLREYVLIEQKCPAIELRRRNADNTWSTSTVDSLDQIVHFASIDVDLPLTRIYERVEFA
jgi:Uma2 family endonuclease